MKIQNTLSKKPKNSVTLHIMYILKIKGKAKIPDYIQLRDENLTLLAYFRVDRPEKALEKLGFEKHIQTLKNTFAEMQFGKIQKLVLNG